MTVVRLEEIPEISDERAAEIAALGDKNIDFSDIPDMSDNDAFWENGVVKWPEAKEQLTLQIDTFVVHYFKQCGPDYESQINSALRDCVISRIVEEANAKDAQGAPHHEGQSE